MSGVQNWRGPLRLPWCRVQNWRRPSGLPVLALSLCILIARPAATQGQMPDAHGTSGIPLAVGDLPDRTVTVRLIHGDFSNNIKNNPVELHAGDKVLTERTDETGRAQFSGLTPGAMVKATAKVDGEVLESQEFVVPSTGGIRVVLVATQPGDTAKTAAKTDGKTDATAPAAEPVRGDVVVGGQTRFVVEIGEDAVQVYYVMDIVNTARSPVTLDGPLVFDLPREAQGTSVMEGSSRQATASGPHVTVTSPFQPGTTPVQIAFQLPYSSERLALSQKLPARLEKFNLVVQKFGGVQVSSPQIASQREMPAQGRTYITATGDAIPADGVFSIELNGLPHHSSTPRAIALSLVFGIVGAGLWFSAGPPGAVSESPRRKRLQTRREKLFADLVRIEEQRQAEHLDKDRYGVRRKELIGQLERVYAELDD